MSEQHLEEYADDLVSSTNEDFANDAPHVEPENKLINMQLQLDRIEKKLDWLIQKTNKEGIHVKQFDLSLNNFFHYPTDECESQLELKLSDIVKINSLASLDEFEALLENSGIKTSLIKQMKKKFEKSMPKYDGCQRKFAYDVIDTFTDRELFKLFSWKGKDAKNGESNKCFENHTTYINFIFESILVNDSKFKYEWLEAVLNVLCRNKNSKTKRSAKTQTSSIPTKQSKN